MDGANRTQAGPGDCRLSCRHEFTSSIREIFLFDCAITSNHIRASRPPAGRRPRMTAHPTELRSVHASLNSLASARERPVTYTYEPPPGTPRRSGALLGQTVRIRDARPLRAGLSLDEQGFALTHHRSTVGDFYDADAVKRLYYPEIERLVGAVTGATRVLAFDHNVRSAPNAGSGEHGANHPVKRVHNDFTATSGRRRARDELAAIGEDADALLKHRFAVVNV